MANSHLEFPLNSYITEAATYSEEDVNLYVIQAIKMEEITFRRENDEIDESPILSKATLKGSNENSLRSNRTKARYAKLEEKIKQVSADPRIREEAAEEGKKKGRLASQSELTERDSLSKTVRTESPKSK